MYLVTGATGNVGREVLALLVEAGLPVRALSRDPRRTVWPAEVEAVAGDLAEPDTLAPALAGVEAVFLFAAPGSGPGVVAAAEAAGVRKVVLLSSGAVDDEAEVQEDPIAAYHHEVERALRASGLEWTFLRPDVFAGNTLMWAGQLQGGDVVRGAYAGATSAPIHESDIAAAAFAALTGTGHAGQAYRLTGPESLSHADQARILGEVIGRPVRFEELPPEVAEQAMSPYVPAPVLAAIFSFWERSVDRVAPTTADVEKLTGRAPRSYREWVADHRAAF